MPRSRWARLGLGLAVALVLAGIVVDRALDAPLRRVVERRMNERMLGYSVRLGGLDFHLIGGSIDLEQLVISQEAYPDSPVLEIPGLEASVEWRSLLSGQLVGELVFVHPRGYVNLLQLQEENRDDVPIEKRGWQQALASIYPLKINELRVVGGSLVYEDTSGSRPLHASSIEASVHNIRNVLSREGEYPSDFHLEARVFDEGSAVLDGAADLLAEPYPGLAARIDLARIELDYFEPIVRRHGLTVRGGMLDGGGRFEYAPDVSIVELDTVRVHAAVVDYLYGAGADEQAGIVARRVAQTAREVLEDPRQHFRIDRLSVEGGNIGFVNVAASPEYRLWIAGADLQIENLSDRPEDGPGVARLRGSFMGSGEVASRMTFYPDGDSPNFEAQAEITDTSLPALNELLQAHANLDVAGGVFAVYSEIRVRDGTIEGYVKPLFRDVDVFDPAQDRGDGVFHKIKEKLVGGLAGLLKNRRDEVVTVARFSGPVENPDANTIQMVVKLIQNGFFQAILPGFLEEVGKGERGRGAARRDRRDTEEGAG